MDVDQYVTERQGLRLERSPNHNDQPKRGTSELGGTRKVPKSSEEMPLTFSKASKGLVPKIARGEVEAGDGGGQQLQGEQGKLLLEVETLVIFYDSNVSQVYSGGTFKKSMNYYSFRETEKRSSREVQDISIALKIVSISIVIIVVIFSLSMML